MPTHSFSEILAQLLSKKSSFQSQPFHSDIPSRFETSIHTEEVIYDADFIQFFLNFLRESSASVLARSSSDASALANDDESQKTAPRVAQNGSAAQRTSTQEFRSADVTPKPYRSLASASNGGAACKNKAPNKPLDNVVQPQLHKETLKCGTKPRREPLSFSDFLSPEAGRASGKSFAKKRSNKKGKRMQLTLVRNVNNSSQSQKEISRSDFKGQGSLLLSEENQSISFNIEEEFPALPSISPRTTKFSKPSRRIKPTTVKNDTASESKEISEKENIDCIRDHVSNDPFVSVSEAASLDGNILSERDLLLKMKNRVKAGDCSEKLEWKTHTKSLEEISPAKKVNLDHDPQHISDAGKLARLSGMYSYYINSFLVPNLIKELQFIVDLLTVPSFKFKPENAVAGSIINGSLCNSPGINEEFTSRPPIQSDLLSTTADCIYFAVASIQSLVHSGIIAVLATSALSLLGQNSRIQDFLPVLQSEIVDLTDHLDCKDKESLVEYGSQETPHSAMSSVMFEAETDDRSNFTSDKSFHAFRKHRDMFYVIVREYDERKQDPNFDIQQHLAVKIRNLASQVKSSATHKHFVRLFVSQMLQEARRGGYRTVAVENSFSPKNSRDIASGRGDLLANLRQRDPGKFRRLQSRFFTASSNSQRPGKAKDVLLEQCFFYKEFLLCADSYSINTHLCNELRQRISDIEAQQIQQILDGALAETVDTPSVSAALSALISSARVLGSFLGFVTFEPYNADDGPSTNYEPSIINCAASALTEAEKNGHELVTVPWVVEYLKSAKFLPVVANSVEENVAEKLFSVFMRRAFGGGKVLQAGDVFLCLITSTLFDFTTFPDGYFYHLLKKYPATNHAPKAVQLATTNWVKNEEEAEGTSFDACCSDLVSFPFIYESHSALRDVRSTIASWNSGATKSSQPQQPSRKIKPSMETEREETFSQKKNKRLQHTLEEHFFRGNPSSLKRTVEFVAERCASNCVKRIRSVSMLAICDEAERRVLCRLRENPDTAQINNYMRGMLTKEIVADMKLQAKERMYKECDEFCDKAVPQCLENLSSCETADGVLRIAKTIAKKRSVDSVHAWLSTRLDELVTMSVKARLTKVFSNHTATAKPMESSPRLFSTDDDSVKGMKSVSSLLQLMKEYTVKMVYESEDSMQFSRTICPSLPKKLSKRQVTALVGFSRSLLENRSNSPSEDQVISSIRRSLTNTPLLRNTLLLATKELENRADQYFRCDSIRSSDDN